MLGSDNQKIGDVSDILFDKSGKVEAFVISVGGFLGVGAKEVACAPSSFDVMPGQNGSPTNSSFGDEGSASGRAEFRAL